MLMKVFRKAGYETIVDVARALSEQGPYADKNVTNLRAYLSQVISINTINARPASPKLAKALSELCGDEIVIEILGQPSSPQAKIQCGLELRLNEVYTSLEFLFDSSDLRGKMRICNDFEDYVSKCGKSID